MRKRCQGRTECGVELTCSTCSTNHNILAVTFLSLSRGGLCSSTGGSYLRDQGYLFPQVGDSISMFKAFQAF